MHTMSRLSGSRARFITRLGLTCALVASSGKVSAQADSTGTIRGRIVDPMGIALEGSELLLRPSGPRTVSAKDGSFILRGLPRGHPAVLIRRIGYEPLIVNVDLSREATWIGQITLIPGPYELPDLDVKVRNIKPAEYAYTTKYDDFFRRKRLGIGSYISREDIERRSATRTVELLHMVPGARLDIRPAGMPTTVGFARCDEHPPRISVWINGQRLIPQGGDPNFRSVFSMEGKGAADPGIVGEMLDRIDPSQIEMIEVYRGTSQIPGEFKDNSCAAIVIWSR